MERETIYLDNDEEITSAVDKLKSADKSSIDLVIPKQAMLLQSVINLKLLKKQAESLGKEITIVTQDKVGKKLAEQIGIAVVEKPGEVPKEVKMSEVEPVSEDDIEFKEKPAAKKAKENEEPVEFKEEADSVLAETAEKVSPAGEPEKLVQGPDEEVEIPEAEVTKPEGKKPKEKNPAARKWKRMGLAFGFGAIAVLVAAYVFVPLGNVTLKVAAAKEKVDFNFITDKNAKSIDGTTQVVPGREVSVESEKTQKFTATGKKKVGTKATGTVKIVNHNYSSSPTLIVAGSRVVADGLTFKTASNVTVPGFVKVGANVTDGTVNVSVEADQVGSQYNLAAGKTFSLPGLSGATTADIYAANSAAFSGGESRDVTFVSTDDISKAKEEIKTALNEELKTKMAQEIRDGERLIENSAKVTEVSATSSVAANAEAAEFGITAKNNMKGLVFKEDDLKKLAESILGDKIGATKEIVESVELISKTELDSYDAEKGELKARLSGEAYIATKLEDDKIKTDISGEKEAKVLEYFNGMEGVDSVELRFFPKFLKRMPRIKSHIYIKTTISKEQETIN